MDTPASVKLSEDCRPDRHLECNLMIDFKPAYPLPRCLTHRNAKKQ